MSAIGFDDHDHKHCIAAALAQAEAQCKSARVQLTESRRRVLEILLQEHRALGAYDILARLAEEGRPSQPPVAYRALDFLVQHGFAHKIERLSAYVACAHPEEDDHSPAFLICRNCDLVAESETSVAADGVLAAARASGFVVERSVIEIVGLCPTCGDATP